MWNQRGHSDWTGLFWFFIIFAVGCFLIEGTFIALTIALWKYLTLRIVFGVLAIAGAIFIIYYGKELL